MSEPAAALAIIASKSKSKSKSDVIFSPSFPSLLAPRVAEQKTKHLLVSTCEKLLIEKEVQPIRMANDESLAVPTTTSTTDL
jgi:hypothetical protein